MVSETIEERRRVAERLTAPWDCPPFHEADDEDNSHGNGYFRVFVIWLKERVGLNPKCSSFADLQERLAGLIDPTCEVVVAPDEGMRYHELGRCSTCGYEASPDLWGTTLRHCPGCGARVVKVRESEDHAGLDQ